MLAECERDCPGTAAMGLFIRGQKYDIEPTDPWAIHFKLPPAARKVALTEHRRRTREATLAREKRAQAIAGGMTAEEFDEFIKPEERVAADERFFCKVGDCTFEAKSPGGLGAHIRAAHPDHKAE